jgi:hypothetical protein
MFPNQDYWRACCANGPDDIAGVAIEAILGDETASAAVMDYGIEHLGADMCPFEPGKTYIFQTVTLYYVGRVSRIVGAFVELEPNCSWVHWTGKLSTLCQLLKFTGFPSGHQRPRTEHIGRTLGINQSAIVGYIVGEFDLPEQSLT